MSVVRLFSPDLEDDNLTSEGLARLALDGERSVVERSRAVLALGRRADFDRRAADCLFEFAERPDFRETLWVGHVGGVSLAWLAVAGLARSQQDAESRARLHRMLDAWDEADLIVSWLRHEDWLRDYAPEQDGN